MSLKRQIIWMGIFLATASLPALAQVQRVAMRTSGISCGTCAAVSEVYFRRMETIDKVYISKSKEAVLITYKAGAAFDPAALRDVLKKTDVGVQQMQISAQGRLQKLGGKDYFVAGKEKFLLTPGPNSPDVPADETVSVEGIVNDRATPMELKVLTVKPAS